MSSFMALGAITAVLRGLLEAGVARHNLSAILGSAPEVSALPPDRVVTGASSPDRINLFLFQATENVAWRNHDQPARNPAGERQGRPFLALDLHYLLTAYGSADFRSEVLLGHAMHVFHETPVLTRQAIGDVLASLTPGALADALSASKLADQAEQIRIIPRVMNLEEVSKIWTALQSQYRSTAAYQVSVVLIEADLPARSALPVLTRGFPIASGGDEGVRVQVGTQPAFPTLEALAPPAGAPAIRSGEVLTLHGHHLSGNAPRARFRMVPGSEIRELNAEPGAVDASFAVQVPVNPSDWRAGVYEVSALIEQSGTTRESNRLPLVLAPRLDAITPILNGPQLESIQVTVTPSVRPGQSAVLIVGDRELAPENFDSAVDTLTFPAPPPPTALPSGQQWVRLRVDGAESVVVNYAADPPEFVNSQSVVIP